MNATLKYVPNFLSLSRIILSFFLIPLILNGYVGMSSLVFAVAAVSDFLDGYCARKFKVSSAFGAALDPLADKIFMVIVYSLWAYIEFIPFYVAAVVIARDLLILSIVSLCKCRGINLTIAPLVSSKINTTIQMLFITLILACKLLTMDIPYFVDAGAAIVCLSTFYSGADYAQKYRWIWPELFK
ncbi:MAG: CDP-alcohol phosphatidyltransferase family protein [Holosporaceae bacterium]|jgi:cardiolipin synthase|nr:CDP-alcohol phosphatidyltransferase family protein [Holosporaceae bacterium]